MKTVFLIQMQFVHEKNPRTLFVCDTIETAQQMMTNMSKDDESFKIYTQEFYLESKRPDWTA